MKSANRDNFADSAKRPSRGRPRKEFVGAPADFLRCRAFARCIKARVLPQGDPQRPQAISVAKALESLGMTWTLSSGRWGAWWSGKEFPSPVYQTLFSEIAPESASWLTPDLNLDPMKRHLAALDAMGWWRGSGEEWRRTKRQLAYEILVRLCADWNPEFYRSPGRGDDRRQSFNLTEYSKTVRARAIAASGEWGRDRPLVSTREVPMSWDAAINPIEPTSVVMAMIVHAVSADMAHIGRIRHWVLDLASGISAIHSLLAASGNPRAYERIGVLSGINMVLTELLWPGDMQDVSEEYPCRDSYLESLCEDLRSEPEPIIDFLNRIRREYFSALREIGAGPPDVWAIISDYYRHRAG